MCCQASAAPSSLTCVTTATACGWTRKRTSNSRQPGWSNCFACCTRTANSFVRLLTQPEIDDVARKVAVIPCTGCGAPVDIRKDPACPHCRSAFSLIDPEAVERAMQGYAKAVKKKPDEVKLPELADALIMLERDRQRVMRENQARRGALLNADVASLDLWALGLAAVWKMLD